MQPQRPGFVPVMVVVPVWFPTSAPQAIGGTSKLPFGFPNGAGLIWNGTVVAPRRSPLTTDPKRQRMLRND
jgi:hypothetical protein